MAAKRTKNPFEVLRMSTKATRHEVIARGKELSNETMDRELQAEYRRAVEEICQHPLRCAYNKFLEPPETCYEDEKLERFRRQHGKPPFKLGWLKKRKKKFVQEECSVRNLAHLAIPPILVPDSVDPYSVSEVPVDKFELKMAVEEIFT